MARIPQAAVVVLALALTAAPMAAEARPLTGVGLGLAGQSAASACGLVERDQYWFCKAIEGRSCGLTSDPQQYWLCKGLLERQCGLIESGDGYRLCHGLTTRNCGVIAGDGYWLCKGITEEDCNQAPRETYWMCQALRGAFRPEG